MTHVIGFTGSRHYGSWEVEYKLHARKDELAKATEFVTGACRGADDTAGRWLLEHFPDRGHRVIVPANRDQVVYWWRKPWAREIIRNMDGEKAYFIVIEMPENSSYKARNERIVACSDELIYFAMYEEDNGSSRRSGTWQTVRIARRKGVPVKGHVYVE